MKILVLAPHMDDEALGCGGSIARHVAAGDDVHVCFVARRIYSHVLDEERADEQKRHCIEAKRVLGYNQAYFLDLNDERLDHCIQEILIPLEHCFNRIKPDIVYGPFYGDNNQDHRAVFDALRVVMRPMVTAFVRRWLLYETPSSTDQSPPIPGSSFMPNHYVNIGEYLNTKLQAVACYSTEERSYPHPRSREALRTLAAKRGIEVGVECAEAFMIIRDVWN